MFGVAQLEIIMAGQESKRQPSLAFFSRASWKEINSLKTMSYKVLAKIALMLALSFLGVACISADVNPALQNENREYPGAGLEKIPDLLRDEKYEEAISILERLHEKGDPKADLLLGKFYANGWYVEKNLGKAYFLYRASAEAGHVVAMNELADALYRGSGVKRDVAESVIWYEKSARAGNRIAAYNLAFVLLGENDRKGAYKWLYLYALLSKDDGQTEYSKEEAYLRLLEDASQGLKITDYSSGMLEATAIHSDIVSK